MSAECDVGAEAADVRITNCRVLQVCLSVWVYVSVRLSVCLCVSVLMADVTGLAALSEECCAAEMVRMLNELFGRFDQLAAVRCCTARARCCARDYCVISLDCVNNMSWPARLTGSVYFPAGLVLIGNSELLPLMKILKISNTVLPYVRSQNMRVCAYLYVRLFVIIKRQYSENEKDSDRQ